MESEPFHVEEDYAFIGRTFEEYCRMFALDPVHLTGRSVLDCPGGPASFAAVASQFGASVTAVDPAYGPPVRELESTCDASVRRTVAQLHEKTDRFVWEFYGDVDTRGRYLEAAMRRFLADYARYPGRYVAGALPRLPFSTDAFGLALSANFLFLYDDRLGLDFHVSAIRELARVAAEGVRLFTLAGLDGERSEYVDPVTNRLRDDGLAVEFRDVPYEFQRGATEAMVVTEIAGYP